MPKGIPKSGMNKGWFKKGEHPSPETQFKKGNISWSTGQTKENNPIVKKIADKLKGQHFSEARIEKMSLITKELWKDENYRNNFIKKMTGKKLSESHKQMMRERMIGEKNPFYGEKHNEITRIKMSQHSIIRLKNKDYRLKKINDLKKNRNLRPNKPETAIINLIKENNLPFNYVGDGKIYFQGENHLFNPDFLSKNPKHIIEVFGDYWHKEHKHSKKDKERLETYSKYGYKTLVIWEHEIKDLKLVLNKINDFIKLDN